MEPAETGSTDVSCLPITGFEGLSVLWCGRDWGPQTPDIRSSSSWSPESEVKGRRAALTPEAPGEGPSCLFQRPGLQDPVGGDAGGPRGPGPLAPPWFWPCSLRGRPLAKGPWTQPRASPRDVQTARNFAVPGGRLVPGTRCSGLLDPPETGAPRRPEAARNWGQCCRGAPGPHGIPGHRERAGGNPPPAPQGVSGSPRWLQTLIILCPTRLLQPLVHTAGV